MASGESSSVTGGGGEMSEDGNIAFAHYSSILGGARNIAGVSSLIDHGTFTQSTVSGGYDNVASADYATVVGDSRNVRVDGFVIH